MICEKAKCVGCYACYNACPKNCISFQTDNEGFCYPVIDNKVCIDCGKCKNVCPVLKPKIDTELDVVCYGGYINDINTLTSSASGGIFRGLAESVIKTGGVVYGASFDDDFYSATTK